MKKYSIFVYIILFIIACIGVFFVFPEDIKNKEQEYYKKSTFFIQGNVVKTKRLGGTTDVATVLIDSISLNEIIFNSFDYYNGLYSKDNNVAYILINAPIEDTCNYIIVDATKRQIKYFYGDTIISETYYLHEVYDSYLNKIKTERMIKF